MWYVKGYTLRTSSTAPSTAFLNDRMVRYVKMLGRRLSCLLRVPSQDIHDKLGEFHARVL